MGSENKDIAQALKPTDGKPSKQTGLVGFYDILGYESFLENNDNDYTAQYTLGLMKEIPTRVIAHQNEMAKHGGASLEVIVKKLQYFGFSDTMVMTMEWPEAKDQEYGHWVVFSFATAMLQRLMFEHGLPLRGGIAFGDYWRDGVLFAGVPFVKAHKASTRIDAAIVALDEQTAKFYHATGFAKEPGNVFLREYAIPHKDGSTTPGVVVDFTRINGPYANSLNGDPRALVTKSFAGHKKAIVPAIYQKLTNTEMFLRVAHPPA